MFFGLIRSILIAVITEQLTKRYMMAKGSKVKYTAKQKRMASHIEDSAKKSGKSKKTAGRIAWATVNKETGGAGKRVKNTAPSKKGGHTGGKTSHSTHASH